MLIITPIVVPNTTQQTQQQVTQQQNCEYSVRIDYGTYKCMTEAEYQEKLIQDEINFTETVNGIAFFTATFIIIGLVTFLLIRKLDNMF